MTDNNSPTVSVKNICFEYPTNKVLSNINLEIKAGESLGLTGPSGCGKSTLASIIAGHTLPSSGQIILGEDNVTGLASKKIFLVPQETDLFPWQTVKDCILFALQTSPPDIKALNHLLELTRLTKHQNHYPHQLSGGLKKRLSIARALSVKPNLIIFDESFNSLDEELRDNILEDLRTIQTKTKISFLFISHHNINLALNTKNIYHLDTL